MRKFGILALENRKSERLFCGFCGSNAVRLAPDHQQISGFLALVGSTAALSLSGVRARW
jgi:hypothetical protein